MGSKRDWWSRRSPAQKVALIMVALFTAVIIMAVTSPDTARLMSSTTEVVRPLVSPTSEPVATTLPVVPTLPVATTLGLPITTASTTTTATPPASSSDAGVRVTEVLDGDTIRVSSHGSEQDVRLIGMDAPETGEDFAGEARAALVKLVGGKTVRLETDVDTVDLYGRLLAYVWVGDVMANEDLLRQGLATVYTVPPDVKYTDRFEAAQKEAQAADRGVWGVPADSSLQVIGVRPDPPGEDRLDLNGEYVTFKVLVSGTLLGYSVEDQTGHRYRFPDRMFKKGDVFKLHTGQGTDTQTDLYWGATGTPIWNNDQDTVKVLDPQDRIVASYDY